MKITVTREFIGKNTLSYSQTRKIADLLEESKLLDKENTRLKKKYGIPNKGYPLKTTDDFVALSVRLGKWGKRSRDLVIDCDILLRKLKLPPYWFFSIITLLMCNVFLPPDDEGFSIISPAQVGSTDGPFSEKSWAIDSKSLQNFLSQLTKENALMLMIRRKMTKTELFKLIADNWPKVQNGMKVLPKIQTHKMIRLRLAKEIRELRDQKKMKFADIAERLAAKYENNIELYDLLTEDYVKNLYNRLKRKSSQVSIG